MTWNFGSGLTTYTLQMMPYDMGSMKSLNPVKLKGSPSGISLNERTDDTLLLTLNTAGKNMALYDIRKEKIVLEFGFAEPSGKTNGHYRAALSPNGQLVASGNVFAADKMENWIWDLRWQGTKRDQPATIVKTQHKNAMQRFLWWNDKTYYSTSTGDGIEYVDLN